MVLQISATNVLSRGNPCLEKSSRIDNCKEISVMRKGLTLALRRGRFRPWLLFICFISSKCVTKYP